MRYGDEKILDMARSILPSRGRKAAKIRKDKAKRAQRHGMNQKLRSFGDIPEHVDPQMDARLLIAPIVRDRRDADKLNHFEKWALQRTAHMKEPDGRLAMMRAQLPKGVIGDHAVKHLQRYDAFQRGTHRKAYESYAAKAEKLGKVKTYRRWGLLKLLAQLPWLVKKLNQAMYHKDVYWTVKTGDPVPYEVATRSGKTAYVWDIPTKYVQRGPREAPQLHSADDVETFLTAVIHASQVSPTLPTPPSVYPYKLFIPNQPPKTKAAPVYTQYWANIRVGNPAFHPEWLRSLDKFLDQYKDTLRAYMGIIQPTEADYEIFE